MESIFPAIVSYLSRIQPDQPHNMIGFLGGEMCPTLIVIYVDRKVIGKLPVYVEAWGSSSELIRHGSGWGL